MNGNKLGLHLFFLAGYSSVVILIYFLYPVFGGVIDPETLHYRRIWISRGLISGMMGHGLLLLFRDLKWVRKVWGRFWKESGTARNLAFFRIVFMFVLSFHALFYSLEYFLPRTYLPTSARVPLPFMEGFIHHIPIHPDLYITAAVLAFLFGISATIGFKTRFSLLIFSLLGLYIYGVPNLFGKLNHNHILVWFPFFLALGPSEEDLSVDALLDRLKGLKVPKQAHSSYLLPLKLIWLQLGVIYFFAGFWKIWMVGLDWCFTDNLIRIMQWEWVENYDRVPGIRIDQWPWLVKLGGLLTLYFELLFPVLILFPKTRWVAFFAGLGFHNSNLYFLNIGFINLQRSYFSLVNWHWVFRLIRSWRSRWWQVTGFLLVGLIWRKLLHLDVFFLLILTPLLSILFPRHILRMKRNFLKYLARFRQKRIYLPGHSRKRPLSRRLALTLGGGLIVINGVCGLFRVNSWPFSAYPFYVDYLTEDHIEYLRIEAHNASGKAISLYTSAEKKNYRKENYMRLEPGIIELHERADSARLDSALRHYVDLWSADFPVLKAAVRFDIFLEASPLQPEQRKQLIHRERIGGWENRPRQGQN